MAHFRIEAIPDASGHFALEAYYPAESTTPFLRTKAKYQTKEEAFEDFKEKFVEMFPDKEPPQDLKPN
jgi:hypothetical protein